MMGKDRFQETKHCRSGEGGKETNVLKPNVQWSTVKNAIKRAQSRTCSSYAKREHFRRSQGSNAQFQ